MAELQKTEIAIRTGVTIKVLKYDKKALFKSLLKLVRRTSEFPVTWIILVSCI